MTCFWPSYKTDKTEFTMFGYRSQLAKCTTNFISISDSTIPRTLSIKYLGVTLDKNLSLKEHILLKCRKAMANFVMIHNIHKFLTKHVCTTLVLDLCISYLDYANALFYGLPEKTISHLQRIQAMCAKLTLEKSKFDSTTEALAHLHWLPIRLRIKYYNSHNHPQMHPQDCTTIFERSTHLYSHSKKP